MSGVGHDPAVQFERHRRSQREERERQAALVAADEAVSPRRLSAGWVIPHLQNSLTSRG